MAQQAKSQTLRDVLLHLQTLETKSGKGHFTLRHQQIDLMLDAMLRSSRYLDCPARITGNYPAHRVEVQTQHGPLASVIIYEVVWWKAVPT